MFSSKRVVAVLAFITAWCSLTASAAEPQKYFKFSCMPELHTLELTTVYSEQTLSEEVKSKYNLQAAGEFECLIRNQVVTLTLERTNWESAIQTGKLLLGIWSPELDINYKVTISAGDQMLVEINDFGAWEYDEEGREGEVENFPHLLTFDGNAVRVCSGLLTRECITYRVY